MKSLWSGSLRFGLLSVPVKVYKATEPGRPQFSLVSKKHQQPIRQRMYATTTDEEVAPEDVVKGIDIGKGKEHQYVVVSPQEMARALPLRSSTMVIEAFVASQDVDPLLYETAYYLAPKEEGAVPLYVLLQHALLQSNTAGIVRFVFNRVQHLGIVRYDQKREVIVLHQLRFASQIRKTTSLKIAETPVIDQHALGAAQRLIALMTVPFAAERYEDVHSKALQRLLAEKSVEQQLKQEEKHVSPQRIIDRLEQSVEYIHRM